MPKHYIVLGGGISGLSLAWSLQKQPDTSVTIIEKETRAGGWIETIRKEDFLFDRGPRSCRTRGSGISTLQLIEELGLASETLPASTAASQRYLYVNQRLSPLPNGLVSLLFSPLAKGLFKALWKDLKTPKGPGEDESIANFVERRLGSHFSHLFFDPLVAGIYAGDIRKLSVRACFPFLAQWDDQGGICRGLLQSKKEKAQNLSPFVKKMMSFPLFTLQNGMESLTRTISSRLHGEILLGNKAEQIQTESDHITVRLSSGKTLSADRLFSTLPSYAIKELIAPLTPFCDQIPCASVAIVNLGYRKKLLQHHGFGYLIPSSEGEKVLGVVFDSCVFPIQNSSPDETRLTVMIGDSRIPDFHQWTKEEFLAAAQEAVFRHLGIEQIPEMAEVKIAYRAIPHYLVGHLDRLKEMEKILATQFSKVTLLGNSFYGVSVNDCVAKAFCV